MQIKPEQIVAFDIETKNFSTDVRHGNTKVISVQLATSDAESLFYSDAPPGPSSFKTLPKKIDDLLAQGCVFGGHNVSYFDFPVLDELLPGLVSIPAELRIDTMSSPAAENLKKKLAKDFVSLEQLSTEHGVPVSHKNLMRDRALAYASRHHAELLGVAQKLSSDKGWSLDFCLKKVAFGPAIYECYEEFLGSQNQKTTDFYKYAMGDVQCERELMLRLHQKGLLF
ncbi:Uncharacterised protein [Candidatus Norongarragalina meridionalis]|nr:Uncharacterised protein [Candidatus Norongarragalina meridionalis]